jgi:serine/threonine protein kinase
MTQQGPEILLRHEIVCNDSERIYMVNMSRHWAINTLTEYLRLWNIIRDIMRGLAYIHSLLEMHCDLKSSQNGSSTPPKIMLLSVDNGSQKMTSFGLTFEGTSRIKYTTRNSRSTQGYRAIELLRFGESGYVTKASDVWALGYFL